MAFLLTINNRTFTRQQLQELSLPIQRPLSEQLSAYALRVLQFVKEWLGEQQEFVVHTSGSTGIPKPIVISRRRMQASAQRTLQALSLHAGEEALLCIHAGYIGGKMMLVRAMEGELPIRVVEAVANPLLHLPADYYPRFTALVPLQLQAILEHAPSLELLNRMKAVIVGGAAISASVEAQAQQVKAPLFSTYGMTETVSHIALRRITGSAAQDYFQLLPGITVSLDSRGCLVIDGPVVEEPVVTNDRVELLDEARFRWLGRADNIINSGGVKVQAEQVEAVAAQALTEIGQQRRVLVAGREDQKLGEKVVLLIEGTALLAHEEESLTKYLLQRLPPYWGPKDILYVANFVESDNGKVKRKETCARLKG